MPTDVMALMNFPLMVPVVGMVSGLGLFGLRRQDCPHPARMPEARWLFLISVASPTNVNHWCLRHVSATARATIASEFFYRHPTG